MPVRHIKGGVTQGPVSPCNVDVASVLISPG